MNGDISLHSFFFSMHATPLPTAIMYSLHDNNRCEKYGKAEGIKVNRETLMTHSAIKNTGKMTVGVHVRKGANVHTFLHSSVKLH